MSRTTIWIAILIAGAFAVAAAVVVWVGNSREREEVRIQEIADRHRALYSRFRAGDVAEIRCAVGKGQVVPASVSSESIDRYPVLGRLLDISLASPIKDFNYDPSYIQWADASQSSNEVLTYTAFDRDGKALCSTSITLIECISLSAASGSSVSTYACLVDRESLVTWDAGDFGTLQNAVRSLIGTAPARTNIVP